jgi:GT2 family glycosyltransferase
MKDIKLSIIIVSYNTKELLKACLESIESNRRTDDKWEVIVVDNASSDESVEYLKRKKQIQTIVNKANIGYSRANNQGIKNSSGEYVLLLNSDTELRAGTLQEILAYMDTYTRVGAVTCKVELPDGKIDPACHRGFPTPWASLSYFLGFEKLFPRSELFSQYHLGYKDMNSIHEIDSPVGAFFLTRRKILEDIKGLDEEYFMYGEDIDLSYRIKEAGWPIVYYPLVSILHRKKQSGRSGKNKDVRKQTDIFFYEAMKIFYTKHFMKKYPSIVTRFIFFILTLRIWMIQTIGR